MIAAATAFNFNIICSVAISVKVGFKKLNDYAKKCWMKTPTQTMGFPFEEITL
jgi:hypothetical protein